MQLRKPFVVLIMAASLLVACGKEQAAPRRAEPPKGAADFKAREIRAVNPSDRPEAQAKATEESARVIAMLNGLYSAGFIDRAKWSGGSHPDLPGFFTAEARPQVAYNLGALALADLAPQIKAVLPSRQDARISFFVEDDLSTPVAVVSTSFEATATPARGKDPISVVDNGTFWLVKEADAYKIYAFSTELKADSQTRRGAFGAPPQGAPA